MSQNNINIIIKKLYQVWLVRGCKVYSDTDWHNVKKLLNTFRQISGISEIHCASGVYYNFINKLGDDLPYRDYDLTIDTEYGQIDGYIRCCAAGTIEDPFCKYDMIVSFWKHDSKMNEALDDEDDGKFHFIDMAKAISKAKNLNDLKAIAKKYITEVAIVGMFLTVTLSECSLDEREYQELCNYSVEMGYDNTIHMGYIDDDGDGLADDTFIDGHSCNYNNYVANKKTQNDWDLITDDVHATVYHAVKNQCKADPSNTASTFQLNMSDPQGHKIIAMERTMMSEYGLHYGDIIKIEGTDGLDGVYQIQDTMNKRFAGQHKIDILVNRSKIKTGQWYNVKLYKLANPELAKDLKKEMKPALNQSKIDKRQTQYDLMVNN